MSRPLSVFDQLLAGTPFRGLVLKGQPGYCAYIGVPESHWLADMEGLQFACHWGVTFRGPGGDGIRPEGWYWYGWDYQHAGDFLEFPEELLAAAPEIAALIEGLNKGKKKWTQEEIEHDLIDAAVSLLEALSAAQTHAQSLLSAGVRSSPGPNADSTQKGDNP